MIKRTLQEKIESKLFKRKAIIIYGARQVGKTTLIKEIQKKFNQNETSYLNCDEPDIRLNLTDVSSTELKQFIGKKKILFIDEAQRIRNIGVTIKLIVDNIPDIQVIATGSSSLDLSNEIIEPLTGRKYEFHLYPLSISEIKSKYSDLEIKRLLERRIIYGMYPEVEQKPDESALLLKNLAGSYLYKDVLQYQDIRRPEILERLLAALALQIGNEVSYNELANLLGVRKETVANYIQLLEKAFVIFRLSPFSRNLRNEISKMRKIYFYDTGIRNALINNFNKLSLRQDTGALWENFLISERIKRNNNNGLLINSYFWRTHQQQEIDYLEEEGGNLAAYEIKWQLEKVRMPKIFLHTYAKSSFKIISNKNFIEFL
jgi:predicted AAA+ superfamily ATPase